MGDTTFLLPASPDNPGIHELGQEDGSIVVITSADEAMAIVLIAAPAAASGAGQLDFSNPDNAVLDPVVE